MENKYHNLDKGQEEILYLSSAIDDAVYVLAQVDSVPYSMMHKGGNCSCRSTASSSPCRASSLESKSESN